MSDGVKKKFFHMNFKKINYGSDDIISSDSDGGREPCKRSRTAMGGKARLRAQVVPAVDVAQPAWVVSRLRRIAKEAIPGRAGRVQVVVGAYHAIPELDTIRV